MRQREVKEHIGSSAGPCVARRAFLTGSTAVAAAGGMAASLGGVIVQESGNAPADPRRLDYRETEHIRKFYQLSRF